MATISENKKEGKVISFRIRVFLDRDSNGKQIVSYTTWHIPEGMTISKARKQVQVYAKGWETEQKKIYADKNQENREEKIADYSFSFIVNNLWFPLIIEHSERKPKTIQSYRYFSDKICSYFLEKDIREISSLDTLIVNLAI